MLALVFEVGAERYAMEARRIIEVISTPMARSVPGAPAWVVGLFARNEDWVPVIDLARLLSGTACPVSAASRVAIVDRVWGESTRTLGLLAPGMTRVIELPEEDRHPGIHVEGQEFLGGIVPTDAHGVQLIDVDRLLPPEVDRLLFGAEAASA